MNPTFLVLVAIALILFWIGLELSALSLRFRQRWEDDGLDLFNLDDTDPENF
jgi:hypothetical protein